MSPCILFISDFPIFCFLTNAKLFSIDEKRLENVVKEIQAFDGDVLAVAGDVGADDFPKKIVDATVQYVVLIIFFHSGFLTSRLTQEIWQN